MQTMRKTGTKIFSWVLLLLLLAGLLTGCSTNDQENSADGQSVLRYGSGDYTYETRGVMDNLEKALLEGSDAVDSWAALRDAWIGVISTEVEKFNQ